MAPIVGHLTAAGVLRRENFVVSAPAAGSVGAVAELFARHLLRGRGLSPASVAGCVWPVRRFLAGHEDRGVVLWDTVTGASVQAFLTGWAVGRGPGAVALAATALRSLLGFAFLSGWTPTDLSRKVAPPGARRPDPLVAALAAADVERLRDSIPADTRIGARDRAVVVVLSRLGLRAGEAASLSLDDIDWRAGVVAVAGKGAKVRTAPLPPDVGDALVRYLRLREAPPGERRVFLREKAPAGPLTAHGVSGIVADRARKAGLGTVHAHRLRHSAATAVVAAGGTLAEAGQLLGHALPHTTSIYARTDAASLRRLAVEWPEARP
ncbi:MAG: site-specific integrase [Propionibacteriaceae bacterium]|nr:site-specific integrase [Propionibacteriaceae bacterium]